MKQFITLSMSSTICSFLFSFWIEFVSMGSRWLTYVHYSVFLQVNTKLENPTRFHLQQNQRRQVEQYLSNQNNPNPNNMRGMVSSSQSPNNRRISGSHSSVPNSPMSTSQEVSTSRLLARSMSISPTAGCPVLTVPYQYPKELLAKVPNLLLVPLLCNLKPDVNITRGGYSKVGIFDNCYKSRFCY